MKRREFVKTTGAAVATGLVAAGCGNQVRPAPLLPMPLAAENGVLSVQLKTADGRDRFPDLAPVGGAIIIPIAKPLPPGAPDDLLLVHVSDDPSDPFRYVAMKSACPHAGCPLGYNPHDLAVECPCHGSRFKIGGSGGCAQLTVLNPPSLQGPPVYTSMFNTSTNVVSITFAPSAPLKATFADHPELKNAGGVAVVNDPTSCSGPVVIVRKDAATAIALSAVCPHMDCIVGPSNGKLVCPCHGSEFTLDGALLLGPAEVGLPMRMATIQSDGIVVS